MDQKMYFRVTTIVFCVIALLHLARIVFGWEAVIGGWMVPVWLSGVAVLASGFLTYSGWSNRIK